MSEPYSLIIDVDDDGQTIELEDGSTWNVSLGDNTISICWYATQRIIVEESGDKSYPYRLCNLDTQEI